jgi:hypothetical protein
MATHILKYQNLIPNDVEILRNEYLHSLARFDNKDDEFPHNIRTLNEILNINTTFALPVSTVSPDTTEIIFCMGKGIHDVSELSDVEIVEPLHGPSELTFRPDSIKFGSGRHLTGIVPIRIVSMNRDDYRSIANQYRMCQPEKVENIGWTRKYWAKRCINVYRDLHIVDSKYELPTYAFGCTGVVSKEDLSVMYTEEEIENGAYISELAIYIGEKYNTADTTSKYVVDPDYGKYEKQKIDVAQALCLASGFFKPVLIKDVINSGFQFTFNIVSNIPQLTDEIDVGDVGRPGGIVPPPPPEYEYVPLHDEVHRIYAMVDDIRDLLTNSTANPEIIREIQANIESIFASIAHLQQENAITGQQVTAIQQALNAATSALQTQINTVKTQLQGQLDSHSQSLLTLGGSLQELSELCDGINEAQDNAIELNKESIALLDKYNMETLPNNFDWNDLPFDLSGKERTFGIINVTGDNIPDCINKNLGTNTLYDNTVRITTKAIPNRNYAIVNVELRAQKIMPRYENTPEEGVDITALKYPVGTLVSLQNVIINGTHSGYKITALNGVSVLSDRLTLSDIVDSLDSGDEKKVLSAAQGKALDEAKLNKEDVIDDLETDEPEKALSAAQGKALNELKLNKEDVVDDLETDDPDKALSAAQGKILNDEKFNTEDIVDNLASGDTDKALSAAQGKALNEAKLDKTAVIDNLGSADNKKALSAAQGKALNDAKLDKTAIVDNLNSTDNDKVLSAAQGKALNDAKLDANKVVDNLTTAEAGKVLSANMGKKLNDSKLDKTAVTASLNSSDETKALSASMGKKLNDEKAPIDGPEFKGMPVLQTQIPDNAEVSSVKALTTTGYVIKKLDALGAGIDTKITRAHEELAGIIRELADNVEEYDSKNVKKSSEENTPQHVLNDALVPTYVPEHEIVINNAYTGEFEDGSEAHPFKSIEKADESKESRHSTYTFKIRGGTYEEDVKINNKSNRNYEGLAVDQQSRVSVQALSITGSSGHVGVKNLTVNGDLRITSLGGNIYIDNVNVKGEIFIEAQTVEEIESYRDHENERLEQMEEDLRGLENDPDASPGDIEAKQAEVDEQKRLMNDLNTVLADMEDPPEINYIKIANSDIVNGIHIGGYGNPNVFILNTRLERDGVVRFEGGDGTVVTTKDCVGLTMYGTAGKHIELGGSTYVKSPNIPGDFFAMYNRGVSLVALFNGAAVDTEIGFIPLLVEDENTVFFDGTFQYDNINSSNASTARIPGGLSSNQVIDRFERDGYETPETPYISKHLDKIAGKLASLESIATSGLKTPASIDLESELPPIEETAKGTYYVIQDMDITAPGHQGRAWNDGVKDSWSIVVDMINMPDGSTIVLSPEGKLVVDFDNIVDGTTVKMVGGKLKASLQNDTTKVDKSDIVNNLTSADSNKPLSAAQGKELKTALTALDSKVDNLVVGQRVAI